MVLSQAARSKKFRDNLSSEAKQEYLAKAKKRSEKNFKPASSMKKDELEKNRKTKAECMRKLRASRKLAASKQASNEQQSDVTHTGKCVICTQHTHGYKKKGRKRINRQISKLHRLLKKEKTETQKYKRRAWKSEKRMARHILSSMPKPPPADAAAVELLKNEGIKPQKCPQLKNTLIVHNCMVAELQQKNPREKKAFLSCKQVKISKVKSKMAKTLNIDRRRLIKQRQTKRSSVSVDTKDKVIKFFHREDVSICLPGKDTVKVRKKTCVKYVLTDFISNLYQKFLGENQQIVLSLATFHRLRPKNVCFVQYNKNKSCLCIYHQNVSLKLQALKKYDPIAFSKSADVFIKSCDIASVHDKLVACLPEEPFSFQEWVRVDINIPGSTKVIKRTRLETRTIEKSSFLDTFIKSLHSFQQHVDRVLKQYRAVRDLKEHLPELHVTIQMDFAENYTTTYSEEVQSAYYDRAQVTIHPMVVHYKKDDKLLHKSFLCVTDNRSHNSAAVLTFMKAVLPKVKLLVPGLKHVHYLTDSPTSQYRNRTMLYIVAHHADMFVGTKASWLYFESGHGKGPCDGAGGSAKRSADLAVKRGNLVRSAQDFIDVGHNSASDMEYVFFQDDAIKTTQSELDALFISPVPGIMSVHAVVPVSPSKIAIRETSCYRSCCFGEDGIHQQTCEGWKVHVVKSSPKSDERQSYSKRYNVKVIQAKTQKRKKEESLQDIAGKPERVSCAKRRSTRIAQKKDK